MDRIFGRYRCGDRLLRRRCDVHDSRRRTLDDPVEQQVCEQVSRQVVHREMHLLTLLAQLPLAARQPDPRVVHEHIDAAICIEDAVRERARRIQ